MLKVEGFFVKFIRLLILVLVCVFLFTGSALADELVVNAEVLAGGASASSVTIRAAEGMEPSVDDLFSMTVGSSGPGASGEQTAVTVWSTSYLPDGSITLHTDPFDPTASFTISYGPQSSGEPTGDPVRQWTQNDVTDIRYAVEEDFSEGVYHGSYLDDDGKEVALDIVYRLYEPENPTGEALPLVFTMHGAGESGSDGVKHMVASRLSTCWAEDEWQTEHPCYVLAPQWPDSDVSNDLELRDKYIAVYHDMIEQFRAEHAVSKTYLACLSMGGRIGLRYLTIYPNEFTAVLMCCPKMQNADLTELSDTPIWLIHAVSDFVNPAQNSVDAWAQLMEAGNENAHLTLLTDAQMGDVPSHGSWQFVFGNADYMQWLFEQG